MRDVASQLRLQVARSSGNLGGVRAAMARAAASLDAQPTAHSVMTTSGRAARATGPSLRPQPQRRRTRRYAQRH